MGTPRPPKRGYKIKDLTKGEPHFIIDFVQLVILLFHLYRAEQEPDLKSCHAVKTFHEQVAPWKGRNFKLSIREVEDALWACQMLSEKGQFWHPEGESMKDFAQKMIGKSFGTWDEFYCFIREKE